MASSSVSNRPTARSSRREHSQPALWTVACVSFLLGAAASTLAIWQLHKLYQATIAPVVVVQGKLQAKYNYQDGDELSPAPGGYFIESSSVDRIYLTGQPLNSYVGQTVSVQGSVSGICGPKAIPCYPLVQVREVNTSPAE